MIRTLLTTTAVIAMMATGAMAQDTTTPPAPAAPADQAAPVAPDATSQPEAPMTTDNSTQPAAPTTDATPAPVDTGAAQTTDVHEPWDISQGYVAVDTDNLGSHLIGAPIYSSSADDAEHIGDVTDLVFSADGQITAVVIGVGGFLGIGEKAVAVDFHSLEFTLAADNTERWVLPTTADALTNAPDFVWAEDEPVDQPAPVDPMAPAAPADTMAPAAPAAPAS